MNTIIRKPNGLAGWIVWGILLVVVLLILVMVGSKLRQYEIRIVRKPPKDEQAPKEATVAVRTLTIEPRQMRDTITIPGKIEGLVEALLSVEKPGRITKLLADKGDTVTKGQRLLQIDDRVWKAALKQADIECREADKDLERWKELETAGAVSVKDFDDIQMRKEMADVAREQAHVALQQCEVRTPINGVVADRFVERGEYANEGEAVFIVVDVSKVKVIIDIPEKDIFSVERGVEIEFTAEAVGDDVFVGAVSFVSPLASRENNSFRTEILVDNSDLFLKPGMIASVKVVRGTKNNAIVVPLSAVIPKKGEHVVFIAEDDRAVRRTAKIDAIVGDEVILSSGIFVGEKVIVEGHRALADGMLVEEKGDSP